MKRVTSKLIAVILLVMSLILSGCGAQDSFLSSVKAGNYTKAIEVYEKKILGNSGKELETRGELENYLSESWDAYVKGSLSQQQFREILHCLREVNNRFWLLPQLSGLEYDFDLVAASKESFSSGTAYAENGDYEAAMQAFEQVIPADTENYENAQHAGEQARQAYIASVTQEARELAASGEYDLAMSRLELAGYVVGYSEEVQNLEEEIVTEYYATMITRAYNSGDYLGVVRYCEDAENDPHGSPNYTDEMMRMAQESYRAYFTAISDAAQAAFGENKDYEAALAVLQNALSEVSFSDALREGLETLQDEYEAYRPTALTSLDPVRKGDYVEIGDHMTSKNTCTDVSGNTYRPENMIYPFETEYSSGRETAKEESDVTVTYVLNYQYGTLSGTVFRPYGSLSCDDWEGKRGQVKIYGDGVKLFDAGDITDATWDPIPFSIDVSGVRELSIKINGRWTTDGEWYAFYERHPRVCVGDLMLQK